MFHQTVHLQMKALTVKPRYYIPVLWSLFIPVLLAHTNSFRSICVYTNWAQYRVGKGLFTPEHINTSLCTHIFYEYAIPEGTIIRALEWNDESTDSNLGMYYRVNKLKEISPNLKVLLSVGGMSFDSDVFMEIAKTDSSRNTFVTNVLHFLRNNKFDGINLAWNFLRPDGKPTYNKENFQLLIEDFRKHIDVEYSFLGRLPLILSVMVPGRKELIDNGLQVANLSKYADFVNINSFDFPTRDRNYVDYNYPLYLPRKRGNIDTSNLTVEWVAQYYVGLGMPKKKINIAVATFGISYNLVNISQHTVLSRADGLAERSSFTEEEGMMAYYEVCDMIKEGAKVYTEPYHEAVHVVLNKTWVGFENTDTITKKACYARLHKFGGLLLYSLDMDDFTGRSCNQGPYPLTAAAHKALTNPTETYCNSYYIMLPVIHRTTEPSQTTSDSTAGYTDSEDSDPMERNARVVCYYTVPTLYSNNTLMPESINANICTHISYNYANVQGLEITSLNQISNSEDSVERVYTQMMRLKLQNPHIKILLAVKGYSVGSGAFLMLVKKDDGRHTFIQNTVMFLRKRNFDGFDIVWENPEDRLSIPSDMLYFHLLVRDLKRAFVIESNRTGYPRLLISLALPARKDSIESGFDVIKLSTWADFISLKTFDFHGSWEKCVGFNSPLFPHTPNDDNNSLLNLDAFVKYYLSKGGNVNKVNIGISTFAVSFTLSNPQQHDVYSPASKPGRAGPFTATPGILAYDEVCQLINDGAKVVYVPSQRNNYMVFGDQWVGYDDKTSVYRKVCYARLHGIRGLMIYSLEFDDFKGQTCNQGQFPLLTTAYNTFLEGTCKGSSDADKRFSSSKANIAFDTTYYFWITLLCWIWNLG